MTLPSNSEDLQWLDALAGNPDPQASRSVNLQGAALRKALQQRNVALEEVVPKADTEQYQQIVGRLKREGLWTSRTFSWKSLTLFVVAAFSVGAALTRMMMLSTVPSTRSAETVVDVGRMNNPVQTVTLRVEHPTQTVQLAAAEAIKLGLAVNIDADSSGHRVLISGFVPNAPEQDQLRNVLGIGSSASGTLLFQIGNKTTQ